MTLCSKSSINMKRCAPIICIISLVLGALWKFSFFLAVLKHFPRPKMPTLEPLCRNLTGGPLTKNWILDDKRALPKKEEMCLMSPQKLESLYHRYFSSIQILCLSMTRLGHLQDGGWEVCQNESLIPMNSCLVYSFGINYDFSFDDEVHQRFGCEVHSFDPSMQIQTHTRAQLLYFHNIGLANYDGTTEVASWKMKTLKNIRKDLGHEERDIDILKVDIEDWEWLVLPEIMKSSVLLKIKQLIIELHIPDQMLSKTSIYWIHKLFVIKDLYDKNYRIFWIHKNEFCSYKSKFTGKEFTACYEVSFLRTS